MTVPQHCLYVTTNIYYPSYDTEEFLNFPFTSPIKSILCCHFPYLMRQICTFSFICITTLHEIYQTQLANPFKGIHAKS